MGKIWTPLFRAGHRVLLNGRPATVLRPAATEGSMILRLDGLEDEFHCHEKWLVALPKTDDRRCDHCVTAVAETGDDRDS
jgi:hypothetical protein